MTELEGTLGNTYSLCHRNGEAETQNGRVWLEELQQFIRNLSPCLHTPHMEISLGFEVAVTLESQKVLPLYQPPQGLILPQSLSYLAELNLCLQLHPRA